MLRVMLRIIILLCLLAAPAATIACAKGMTPVEEDERVTEKKPETITAGH
jgi:hypothetical protein